MSSAASIPHPSIADPLLRVRGLTKRFPVTRSVFGKPTSELEAVSHVDLDVAPGETVALVGESGCGKSTLARLVLRLIEATEGSVEFDGIDVREASGSDLKRFRRQAQIVFQDPFGSLDPRFRVQAVVTEGMTHLGLSRGDRDARVAEVLELVELSTDILDRYPHEFSGGQRQRISIARAIAVGPRLLVLDEPVSALDVSVQSKILNLLTDLQERLDLTYLFISHDMSVVRHVADRVAVMYLGKIVEMAPVGRAVRQSAAPVDREALLWRCRRSTAARGRGGSSSPGTCRPQSTLRRAAVLPAGVSVPSTSARSRLRRWSRLPPVVSTMWWRATTRH